MLKVLDQQIRKFTWAGDVKVRKIVIVAWKRVCTPTIKGGLGVRSLGTLNETTNLALICSLLLNSGFLRARFFRFKINYKLS